VVFFAVLAVGLAAVAWPIYRSQQTEFEKLKQDLSDARSEVEILSQRPRREEFEDVTAKLAKANSALAGKEAELARKTSALDGASARVAELQTELAAKSDRLAGAVSEVERLAARVGELATVKDELDAELAAMTENYENARRAASGKENLLDKLDATSRKAASLEKMLAETEAELAAREEELAGVRAELERAMADIAERDEMLSKLRKELADVPLVPLPDELAEQKYHEYLNKVAEFTDRERRVATLFRAKIALAGSSYEDKADSAWRREMRRKQDDIDRAARVVYDDVSSKVRLHPDAHDENVRLLEEALEKVRGSRYEKIIQQLIDREHELKAVGR
jgi:chromosome segregation ATPase